MGIDPIFIHFDYIQLETIQRNLEIIEHTCFLCFRLDGEEWPVYDRDDGALRVLPAVTIKIGCSELRQVIFVSATSLLRGLDENIGRALFVFLLHERCAEPRSHLDLPELMLRLAEVLLWQKYPRM